MPWDPLVEYLLAAPSHERELDVENEKEYGRWGNRFVKETQNFLRRAENLDLVESEDCEKWYELIDQYTGRLRELRRRDEITDAPIQVFGAIDELIEELADTDPPAATTIASISRDPFKRAEREQEREKKKREQIERIQTERDDIAEMIDGVLSAFDEE